MARKRIDPGVRRHTGNCYGPNTCTCEKHRKRKTPAMLQKQCDDWNKDYPIGTEVVRTDDFGEEHLTKTRSAASVLGDHSAVIWLNDVVGSYSLDRVKPRKCGCPTCLEKVPA